MYAKLKKKAEAESKGAFSGHIDVLQKHIDAKKQDYEAAKEVYEKVDFAKITEIDQRGQDLIDEEDLAEYCENLAEILDDSDVQGLKSKLEAEIMGQKDVFQVGGTQLVKTDAIAAGGEGAFSIVQMACKWDKGTIEVRYIQKGRSWAMPAGGTSPDLSIMVNYWQYSAVGNLISELEAMTPAKKFKEYKKMGLMDSADLK